MRGEDANKTLYVAAPESKFSYNAIFVLSVPSCTGCKVLLFSSLSRIPDTRSVQGSVRWEMSLARFKATCEVV